MVRVMAIHLPSSQGIMARKHEAKGSLTNSVVFMWFIRTSGKICLPTSLPGGPDEPQYTRPLLAGERRRSDGSHSHTQSARHESGWTGVQRHQPNAACLVCSHKLHRRVPYLPAKQPRGSSDQEAGGP